MKSKMKIQKESYRFLRTIDDKAFGFPILYKNCIKWRGGGEMSH